MEQTPSLALLNEIVDRVSVGILVVNKNYELVLWNNYMENYSQKKASDIVGSNIFKTFPDLPKAWLEQKVRNVFILKNFSFTSWEHRPYLFKFLHNRPITGGIDYMRQNCTFLPIKGESGEIEYVCITILDVTDTSIYENMLKSAVKSLAEVSNRDGLTNIYNRRFLEQTMSKEFARIKRYGGTLSFVIIDLDHFKKVNDTHGHLAGDEILKIASKRIGECLRESDILARYGGEEFAVLLPETPLQGADILANRLCKHLAKEPVFFNDIEIHISASLGVAEFQPDLETHEQLISRADEVLYISKENGRNRVTLFDHDNPEAHLHKNEDKTSSSTGSESKATNDLTPEASNQHVETEPMLEQQASEDQSQLTETIDEAIIENTRDESPEPATEDNADLTEKSFIGEPSIDYSNKETAELSTPTDSEEIEPASLIVIGDDIHNDLNTSKEVIEEQAKLPEVIENDFAMDLETKTEPLLQENALDSEVTSKDEVIIGENTETEITTNCTSPTSIVEALEDAESDSELSTDSDITSISIESEQIIANDETPIIEECEESKEIIETTANEAEPITSDKVLTAEEKADLAMIEAYGEDIEEETSATVVKMTPANALKSSSTQDKAASDSTTIHVKLGRK